MANPDPAPSAVRLRDVRKVYGTGVGAVVALDSVSAAFERRSFTAVMGPSGSGKSTLLHCAAGLDSPTSGSITLDGREITDLDEHELTLLRRDTIGYVSHFQSFNLLPVLTLEENVVLPLQLAGRKPDRQLVDSVIARLGLDSRRHHRPSELSGGQQQRVAIARALVTNPAVVFADEPTGALDSKTAREILALMQESVQVHDQTIVMVTHDPVAASYADRVVFLTDGLVVAEMENPTVDAVAVRLARLGERVEQRAEAADRTG